MPSPLLNFNQIAFQEIMDNSDDAINDVIVDTIEQPANQVENKSINNQVFDRRNMGFIKRWWLDIDKINFLIVIGIITFGLMMTASSSPAIAKRIDVEKFFFLKKQIIFAVISISLLISISFLNQERIKIVSIVGLFVVIGLLVLVLLFGSEAKGAKRWISLGGFTLQPSEFAKAFFVIFNAYILQKFHFEKWQIKYGISTALYFIIIICHV